MATQLRTQGDVDAWLKCLQTAGAVASADAAVKVEREAMGADPYDTRESLRPAYVAALADELYAELRARYEPSEDE